MNFAAVLGSVTQPVAVADSGGEYAIAAADSVTFAAVAAATSVAADLRTACIAGAEAEYGTVSEKDSGTPD